MLSENREITCDALRDLYHLYNFKNVKNTHGGVLLLVKFQTKARNFSKSSTLPWVFFTLFKFCKGTKLRKASHTKNFTLINLIKCRPANWLGRAHIVGVIIKYFRRPLWKKLIWKSFEVFQKSKNIFQGINLVFFLFLTCHSLLDTKTNFRNLPKY